MNDEFKLSVALNDEGHEIHLRTWDDLQAWLNDEQQAWSWLSPGGNGTNVANVGEILQSNIVALRNTAKNEAANGQELANFQPQFGAAIHAKTGPIIPSQSVLGEAIIAVREVVGDDAAAAAYAFSTGLLPIGSVSNRRQLQGILAATFPAFEPPLALASRLAAERANMKSAQRNMFSKYEHFNEKREKDWTNLLRRSGGIARRMLRRRRKAWSTQQSALAHQQLDAISSIKEVERTYLEAMRLQAPVRYWTQKAKTHGKSEAWAIGRLCLYFPLAIIILGWSFWSTGSFLFDHATNAATISLPAAFYVVVSGGLALASTFALWIGRILTKLYLSEHHLRNDAHERAVMTTTYLALTRENAAGEADRKIILGALFRATPDGIVKDDGPGDLNIAAILSRLGVK